MKFMVTSRKGAAAAVAFLLASPVVALAGVGAGVAQAGVLYGPTESALSGSLFFETGSVGPPAAPSTSNVQSNNTNTDSFSISLNPASPGVGTPVAVSFSGVTGARTGPVGVNANGSIVRVTMDVSGSNTATLDLASGAGGTACDYPATRTEKASPEGPYTATGTYTPSSTGSTTFALKQIYFDDMGNKDGSSPKVCNGTFANADYYVSDVTQTVCSSCSGVTSVAKTAPAASPTIKVAVTVNDTPGPTDTPTSTPTSTPTATPTATPTPTGPTQDISSTVTEQVAGVRCENAVQPGGSNWTDGDTGDFASPAGSGAKTIPNPFFTVALTPAAPTAGQKVTIAVTFDKGITNGPSKQDEGKTRPSARVLVTGALTTTIIVNGTPYGTTANPVLPGARFPGQTMTKANAFTFPADASETNPVFVELQTIAFDTKSQQPNFNWPNGPADTFLTICNKSANPLTATASGAGRVTAQAAIVPIGVTAAVPFEGEVTPPPTIPPADDNGGGGDGTDTSGGTLPKTGGNPISSLWVALILFQIGLIMAVRSVRAAPVKTARHL